VDVILVFLVCVDVCYYRSGSDLSSRAEDGCNSGAGLMVALAKVMMTMFFRWQGHYDCG
jgi:hypothetical protein